MIINWELSIGYLNVGRFGSFEMPDGATEGDIEKAVQEAVFEWIEWDWAIEKTPEGEK